MSGFLLLLKDLGIPLGIPSVKVITLKETTGTQRTQRVDPQRRCARDALFALLRDVLPLKGSY
jgi:hypothetical protein